MKKSSKSSKETLKSSIKADAKAKVDKSLTKKKTKKSREITYPYLRKFNLVMAALHAAQGVAVLLLSKMVTFPITTNYLTIDSQATQGLGRPVLIGATRHLWEINLAHLVVAFFFMSAVAHLVIATVYRRRYESGLDRGINRARWYEYGISASTMMVAIGVLSGISDVSTLLMIFALDLVMNLMGLMMEVHNQKAEKVNWLSYIIGCIAGIVPWLVFAIYVYGASIYGTEGVPGFVYGIYASIFIFFNLFAVNMWLQYRRKGKWANYLYGERAYIVLSLVAKSALAWQVFAGTLRP